MHDTRAGLQVHASAASAAVIIPCFGQARFLRGAIESALDQTRRPAEIIVVDDGSPDDTVAVTEDVAASSPLVRLIRQNNRGVAAARNAGWLATTADCVVFLDADDRLRPTALETGLDVLAGVTGAAMAAGRVRLIVAGSAEETVWPREGTRQSDAYASLLRTNPVPAPAAAIFRRSAVETVGGFDESFAGAEDYDLYLRIAQRFPVVWHDAIVAEYRRHQGSTTADAGHMLRETTRALRSQLPIASRNVEHAKALAEGMRHWESVYGPTYLRSLGLEFLETRRPARIAGELPLMVRLVPSFAVRLLRKGLRKMRAMLDTGRSAA